MLPSKRRWRRFSSPWPDAPRWSRHARPQAASRLDRRGWLELQDTSGDDEVHLVARGRHPLVDQAQQVAEQPSRAVLGHDAEADLVGHQDHVVAFGNVSIGAVAIAADDMDPRYKPYQSTSGVSGTLKSIGSDTLNNLMTLWAEDFRKIYPGVKIEIEGKGSSTAPPALIAGTAQFGPMSRPMKPSEADEFEKKFGYKPTALGTSIDMLAVYVHKDEIRLE